MRDAENYLPIALVNKIVKLFISLLYNRLSRWVEANHVPPEFQNGFRRGRGCLDNIFVLNSIIQYALNGIRGKLFALFVDFRRAFPSVCHAFLWEKLHRAGISSKVIKILISLYSQAFMFVKMANSLSQGVEVTEGVLPGEILSPLLFAIFLADLEAFLRNRGMRGAVVRNLIRIILFAYVDDIVLFTSSWEEMEFLLECLCQYCELNQFKINIEKTKVVIFRKGGRNFKKSSFKYGEEDIQLTSRYEYLGVVFDS